MFLIVDGYIYIYIHVHIIYTIIFIHCMYICVYIIYMQYICIIKSVIHLGLDDVHEMS